MECYPEDADKNPQHWEEYSNFQSTKHELIRLYLSGWFSILGSTHGRIVYFDTHAGRGKYDTGEAGSPLVAIRALLSHYRRDSILENCEVVFYLIERDSHNFEALKNEIAALGTLPRNVLVKPFRENCFKVLAEVLSDLRARKATPAPTFIFVDPYNFAIPGSMLKELMSYRKVELFITLMWRELDMRMHIKGQPHVEKEIDDLLLGPGWKPICDLESDDERADRTIDLMRERIGARWATHIFMLRDRSNIRYILLHLTNHESGRDLIKEQLWKACPLASGVNRFFARKSENHHQLQLIEDEPDLGPLEEWVLSQLRKEPRRWHSLYGDLREQIWTRSQMHGVISELRRQGRIGASDYGRRFSEKADPLLGVGVEV